MDVRLLVTLLVVAGIALFVWWLLVLIEVVRTPAAQWDAAGQSQLVHVLLMLFLGVIGTIIYLAVARPPLRAAGQGR
jgi:hypothetical protein